MARTPEQRGPFGRWLVRERKSRGWSADEMRQRVQEARGFAMAHSTYALLESGQRQPTEEQRVHLTAFLGSEPEHEQAGNGGDDPRIAGLLAIVERQQQSIDALAQAVTQLVARLDDAVLVVARPSDTGGPLPPQGLARGVRDLLRLELAEEQAEDPEGVPGEASPRDTGR